MVKEMQETKSDYERYKELWGMTQRLNEDIPEHLLRKLTIYGQLYEMTGKFSSSARADARHARFERQMKESKAFMGFKEGTDGKKYTQKEREHKTFLATHELRKLEIEYENESDRWESARDSVLEQINIMKRKQDIQMNLFQRGNSINGGR